MALAIRKRSLRTTALVAPVTAVALALSLTTAPSASAQGQAAPTGVDVASWQHPESAPIDWNQVAGDQHNFAVVKATEGIGYINPHLHEDTSQAAATGMVTGTYHLARPGESATLQAAEYAAALASVPQTTMPPVLDIEYHDDRSPREIQDWTREFLTELERLTGQRPMIYTNRFFWEEHLGDTAEFADYPLWLAAYQNHPPTQMPGGWEHMSMWQHSETGQVNGINAPVDLNIFNGTHDQFGRFLAGQQINPGHHQLPPTEPGGEDLLTQSNVALVGIVLAIAAGVLAAGQLGDAADGLGLAPGDVEHLTGLVTQLQDSGDLPVEDLRRMVESGEYTIGDLILLLESTLQPGV